MDRASAGNHVDAASQVCEDAVVIGVVNNMSDAALRITERQFRDLLLTAPLGRHVRLRRFFLSDIPRSEMARSYLQQNYEDISDLWDSHIDALIVTGAEPRAASLIDEPYWNQLARLVDWAERNTISTFWSCLAAHAAVLQIDGLARCPLGGKLSGVFECKKIADHPLLTDLPSIWQSPHSRYNELPTKSLEALGYQVLSTSDEAGADLFIKQRSSLFVFMQGHSEYDPDALFREYRRDVIRFLSGESLDFPQEPRFYFDHDTALKLAAFRAKALDRPNTDLLVALPVGMAEVMQKHPWREPAKAIFANWVAYLVKQKSRDTGIGGNRFVDVVNGLHLGDFGRQAVHHIDAAGGP